jgi:methylthioribose-1-phosphate isomerase
MYNARPYSSDTKDREKKANPYDSKPNKLFGYDTFTSNLKSAYEQKVMGKVGTAPSKGVSSAYGTRTGKKKEETKGFMANDRPSSANNEETKKPKPTTFNSMFGRDEMMVTGSSSSGAAGKKRFPSSNPKQEGYRFK